MASDNRLLGGAAAQENHKPYVYQEYPKVVYPDGKEPVTVQNAAEEKAIMGFVTYDGQVIEDKPKPKSRKKKAK